MLYTRKGDDGTTKTLRQKPGERVSKASCHAEALGALDELNSFLGLCKVKAKKENMCLSSGISVADLVHEAQENLFIAQAELAGAEKTIVDDKVKRLEVLIDGIEKQLPAIKTFFIPGGTELGVHFDVARTLARKAERRVIAALEKGEASAKEGTRAYLNRISSFLYALARFSNHQSGAEEIPPSYM